MFAIVGASGKVGYSTSVELRKAGAPVRAILRDPAKAAGLKEIGCEIAIADLQDPEALAMSLADADAVQIITPVSPQAKDPAADMRDSIDRLVTALKQARPKRVLASDKLSRHTRVSPH